MLSTNGANDNVGNVAGRVDHQFGGDGETEGDTPFEHMRLLDRWDTVGTFPSVDVGGRFVEFPSHRSDTAEECKDRDRLLHEQPCAKNLHKAQAKICADVVQVFRTVPSVTESVNIRLKNLRLSAKPKLTIRGMAEELGIGYSRYSYFEDPKRYKKTGLPLDLTRQIAAVLARYEVDPSEVMLLAGLTETEAEPEVREIEAQKPQPQYFTAQVLLPSENALAAMLEPLLAMIPEEATLAEAARMLARRLPGGFAAIGPAVLEIERDEEPEHASHLPTHAAHHPERPWRSRS